MTDETRPDIETITTGKELRRWYWLKAELVAYCRAQGIPYSGKKFDVLERIAHYLDTGEIAKPQRKRSRSQFDWANATLTPETVITDSYKNNQNVRSFFESQVGAGFSFNVALMRWMRENVGKTLADAVLYYQSQQADASLSEIPDHNQYNQYLRDFFEANPDLTMREARLCWEYKRAQPSDTGRHHYDPADLAALTD